MREASGRVVEWLLSRFPLDAVQAFSWRGSTAGSELPGSAAGWAPVAMERAEAFGMACSSPSEWIAACARSARAGAYFASTLANNSAWSAPAERGKSGAERAWARAKPFVDLLAQAQAAEVVWACAPHVAARAKALLAGDPAGVGAQIRRDLADMLYARVGARLSIAPVEPLLDMLPTEMFSMGGKWLELGSGEIARREMSNLRKILSGAPPRGAPLPTREAPQWELGAYALMGASIENFEFALARGWIAPFSVSGVHKCESPDFIAWDQARAGAERGSPISMEPRWAKCRESISDSDLPERKKAELLDQCLVRSSARWSPGDPKVIVIGRKRLSSPLALLLASPWNASEDEAVRLKATALSRAGFGLLQATRPPEPLADLVNGQLRGRSWLSSLLEREELSQAAQGAQTPSRRARAL